MSWLKRFLRFGFERAEALLDRAFGPSWNPLHNLGALGFFYYWIVAVSGVYLYIFFDTGTTEAYDSIEYMTHDQWYLAGVMRSFHRYASDGVVLFMAVHMLREFSLDRYRGVHWFTWVTGIPVLGFVFIAGITGYWLVWDKLAQYVAIASTEWFDWLPIFGELISRNFMTPESLDDRFFTLLVFMHIVVPLFLLLVLWIHLQRVSRPKINPPRGLAIGTFLMLLALSLVKPATSHGPADLTTVAAVVRLDWFYLGLYPLLDYWSNGAVWGVMTVLTVLLAALPWMPPMRRAAPAVVDLAHCNGCTWCAEDCPYTAISMERRSDGLPFDSEAVVDPDLCVICGICVGSCPSATPFRRTGLLSTGIDMPDRPLDALRKSIDEAGRMPAEGNRVIVFGCASGPDIAHLGLAGVSAIALPCVAQLPPSFIDYALSRGKADGVVLTGCREGACSYRFGLGWTIERIERTRDPRLRGRVARERIACLWLGIGGTRQLAREIDAFASGLEPLQLGHKQTGPPPAPTTAVSLEKAGGDD
ncbi:MAG: hydrogenase iron-sulfur subunit [Inquilinus sp.]|nr:hydrogenase iron-sulfur subunit [Inquilinus sp.]